jgi:hypothetical protein
VPTLTPCFLRSSKNEKACRYTHTRYMCGFQRQSHRHKDSIMVAALVVQLQLKPASILPPSDWVTSN